MVMRCHGATVLCSSGMMGNSLSGGCRPCHRRKSQAERKGWEPQRDIRPEKPPRADGFPVVVRPSIAMSISGKIPNRHACRGGVGIAPITVKTHTIFRSLHVCGVRETDAPQARKSRKADELCKPLHIDIALSHRAPA